MAPMKAAKQTDVPESTLELVHLRASQIELPGGRTIPVTPQRLDGADREQAWQRIAAAAPRIAKYQSKSDRQYPVIRLVPR